MGRFLVLGVLGRGGMGVVVEAHDATLDRNVALKLLSSTAARHSDTRLLREAQALARLSHPNVVQVYDVGELDGQTFIAMELVRGRTLRAWGRARHPWRTVVSVYLQAARGLAAAHAKGLVHRDFKPENCIIDDDGRVRVLDFGLARALVPPQGEAEPRPPDETQEAHDDTLPDAEREPAATHLLGESLTRSGVLMGTIAYMSFEQLKGRAADALSDQYSFCASLFEALHGVGPYAGEHPASLFAAMLAGKRRPVPAGVVVPRRLSRALWRGLDTDPSRRWPSMHALIAELEALSRGRRSRAVVLALGVGLTAGAAMTFAQKPADPCPSLDTVLGGTWDADARARVEQALVAHGPAEDPTLPARVLERLDAHAHAWAAMTRDACEATFVARRQSEAQLEQRTRCLERHRNRLVATGAALADAADAGALAQALVLPFRLPGLDGCAEASLSPVDVGAEPDDERHVALRRAIDQASTLRDAGRMDEAAARAGAAVTEARALGHAGLMGEALECLGRAQTELGMLPEAQASLEQAIVMASDAEDDATLARAWVSLLFVTTMRDNHDETQHHALAARAAVEREDDDVLRAWLLNNLGVSAAMQGKYGLSRQQLEQALALKRVTLGDEHVDVGIAWQNLGTTLVEAGEHRPAVEALARARRIFTATIGELHPWSIFVLGNACRAEHGLGHASRAAALCEQAMADLERLDSIALRIRAGFALADTLWRSGQQDQALAMERRAIELGTTTGTEPALVEQHVRWLAHLEKKQQEEYDP
jgi:eukaryotic-like serine/threonine-protein kinase